MDAPGDRFPAHEHLANSMHCLQLAKWGVDSDSPPQKHFVHLVYGHIREPFAKFFDVTLMKLGNVD